MCVALYDVMCVAMCGALCGALYDGEYVQVNNICAVPIRVQGSDNVFGVLQARYLCVLRAIFLCDLHVSTFFVCIYLCCRQYV